jgi:hypothetical protein
MQMVDGEWLMVDEDDHAMPRFEPRAMEGEILDQRGGVGRAARKEVGGICRELQGFAGICQVGSAKLNSLGRWELRGLPGGFAEET